MNATHSTARRSYEYQPTIIETRLLIERLTTQIAFVRDELIQNWIEFKTNPLKFLTCLSRTLLRRLRNSLSAPYVLRSFVTAITTVLCIVFTALVVERVVSKPEHEFEVSEQALLEVVLLNFEKPAGNLGIGRNGTGPVGFQSGSGEGSGQASKHAQGGGSGGDGTPLPVQAGEIPPPSPIPAPIPIAPPLNPSVLPAAGIDIDPALWQDLKEPVYGEPLSTSQIPSKGPGSGEGMGTKSGSGIGDGLGPGFGPGTGGNTGIGNKQIGCCGSGGGGDPSGGGGEPRFGFGVGQVGQRARVLFKPEPQYTEEARRNQITGTVMLRVVFSSTGEVVQIRAVRTLPFGLTERAIAAARQIRFVPATNNGRPVSVFMQLEYNFNLY